MAHVWPFCTNSSAQITVRHELVMTATLGWDGLSTSLVLSRLGFSKFVLKLTKPEYHFVLKCLTVVDLKGENKAFSWESYLCVTG